MYVMVLRQEWMLMPLIRYVIDLGKVYQHTKYICYTWPKKNQIDDFVDWVAMLEESIKTCAKLLVQAHLGNIDLVPEDARNAMMSMEKIVQALRGLDTE